MEHVNIHMHDIAQKQIFKKNLLELDPDPEPDPDWVVKLPDPDLAKRSGSGSGSATLCMMQRGVKLQIRSTSKRRKDFTV